MGENVYKKRTNKMRKKKERETDRSMKGDNGPSVMTSRWNIEVPVALEEDVMRKLASSRYATKSELVRSLIRAWLNVPHHLSVNMRDSYEDTEGK